jgi:HD superfamily phosphodiesterase
MSSDILDKAFQYVILTSKEYNIDESHSLKHSIEVLTYANNIYKSELINNPWLIEHHDIICVAAILHDMCDKKYMNENEGIIRMKLYMNDFISDNQLDIISQIIQTMSYSKVKINGFPRLNNYQLAYNIVREADLLAAYDIDRCIIYGMMVQKYVYTDAVIRAKELFINRVLKYIDDDLFFTSYAKNLSLELHTKAITILNNY